MWRGQRADGSVQNNTQQSNVTSSFLDGDDEWRELDWQNGAVWRERDGPVRVGVFLVVGVLAVRVVSRRRGG